MKTRAYGLLVCLLVSIIGMSNYVQGQQPRRKVPRTAPPKLASEDFQGVFFDDVLKHLVGEAPSAKDLAAGNKPGANNAGTEMASEAGAASGEGVWKERISAQSIEDLVKECKRRLDSVVTTPAKFSGGGFKDARREFSLLAVLFVATELYPEKVRWQNSASIARTRFARMATNAKVGSGATFNEAKARMEDLATLLKGSPINDSTPAPEIVWPDIADRGPSMQLLEWALRENINPATASEKEFKDKSDELVKYAELVGIIGETLCKPGMNDAEDEEYKNWTNKMIAEAKKVTESVKLNNYTMAREAAGQLDQSCNSCHNTFR